MWAFIRTSIVERIWEEEPPATISPPVVSRAVASTLVSASSLSSANGLVAPPVPPRKRGLWGLASAIGERAASWSESSSEKAKKLVATPENKLPPPHPYRSQERPDISTPEAPVLASFTTPSTAPPPLPQRSEGRIRNRVNSTFDFALAVQDPNISASPVAGSASVPVLLQPPSEIRSSFPVSEATTSRDQPTQSLLAVSTPTTETPTPPSTPPQTSTQSQARRIPPQAAQRISTSFSRSSTPSNIPLPESRPETPVATNQPPSRASSPAFGTTNGMPPPIPRRAPTRAPKKPLGEVRDSSQSSSLNIPISPSKASDVQTQVIQSQPQLDGVKKAMDESENKNETEELSAPKASEAPKAIEPELSMHSGASAFSEPDISVDAEEGAQAEDTREEAAVRTVKEDETKGAHEESGGDATEETKEKEVADTSQQKERPVIILDDQKLPPASNATPTMPPRRSKQKTEVEQGKVDEVNEYEAEDPLENRLYVGGTTWEEKIWRELTKLREEMFLARVGAVRS